MGASLVEAGLGAQRLPLRTSLSPWRIVWKLWNRLIINIDNIDYLHGSSRFSDQKKNTYIPIMLNGLDERNDGFSVWGPKILEILLLFQSINQERNVWSRQGIRIC